MDTGDGQEGKKTKQDGQEEVPPLQPQPQPQPQLHTAAEVAALEASLVGRDPSAPPATPQGGSDPSKLMDQYQSLLAKQQNGEAAPDFALVHGSNPSCACTSTIRALPWRSCRAE